MADFYELLGVSRSASNDEIKRAYRQRARELHPDANPDDAATAERFKEVARAYQVLSDPEQRARYDRFGEAGVSGAGGPRVEDMFGGGGLNDLFDAFFGGQNPFGGGGGRRGPSGPPRGQDLEVVVDISFEQARVRRRAARLAETAAALRRVRWQRRRRRHTAGDVLGVQRQRPGPAGAPEPARPDGHVVAVPAVQRPRAR